MNEAVAFRLTQGFYWLFLGIWVGGMVMLVIGAAMTFRTVREYQPTLGLAPYNHPSMAQNAAGILAGGITGNVLKGLRVLQIICAVVVTVCLVLQCTVHARALAGGVTGPANLLRVALLALPVLVLAVDSCVISPRIWKQRSIMYDPALSAATRDEARAVFQRLHKLDERVVGLAALSLAAAVFASAFAFRMPDLSRTGSPDAIAGKDVNRG